MLESTRACTLLLVEGTGVRIVAAGSTALGYTVWVVRDGSAWRIVAEWIVIPHPFTGLSTCTNKQLWSSRVAEQLQ
jgi:hypothetical protein